MAIIKQMLIPATNKRTRPGTKRVPRTITIHETGNNNKGANALTHANLQFRGNDRVASWHYQVDDGDIIYQSVPDDEVAYAAGDGVSGEGNKYSIHIEVCINSDGDYLKAMRNAAWLVRTLLDKHPIIVQSVVQHKKWTGKDCPHHLIKGDKGITWVGFINMVNSFTTTGKEVASMPEPVKELPVSASHKPAWDRATKFGFLNGERPRDNMTREQFATSLMRVYDSLTK